MVQRAKRRMRCEECGGFQTRKAGGRTISPVSMSRRTTRRIQRYHCRGCGKYFTKRREPRKKYTFHFKGELVRMHVEERLSCRVIAKRIQERLGKRIHPSVVNRMINEVAARTKSSVEMKLQYQPHWSGYVTVDDKWVNVRGRQRVSLLAVDSLGDPLHSELGREPTQEMYDQFLLYVRDEISVSSDYDGFGWASGTSDQAGAWPSDRAPEVFMACTGDRQRVDRLSPDCSTVSTLQHATEGAGGTSCRS